MKRLLAVGLGAALTVAPLAAQAATKPPAKKPTSRTVTWDYQGPAGPHAVVVTGTLCTETTCTLIPLEKHETKAVITVTDDAGQEFALGASVDTADSFLCGGGELPLSKNAELVLETLTDPECPGLPTTGTVTVTITGLK